MDAPTVGARAVVAAATRGYLRGEPLDMSALAVALGISRATLYRWVGNREDLLAQVLADAAERTFRRAAADGRHSGSGPQHVVGVVGGFVTAVLAAQPLRTLAHREPVLFVRLTVGPGAVETRVTELLYELLEQQSSVGALVLALPGRSVAEAVGRVCAAHVHAGLLGQGDLDVARVGDVVSLLLGQRPSTQQNVYRDSARDGSPRDATQASPPARYPAVPQVVPRVPRARDAADT